MAPTPSEDEDISATFALIQARARRRNMRNLARKVPAVTVMLVTWAGLVASGIGWLVAAIPAALLGAAVLRGMEKALPEDDD